MTWQWNDRATTVCIHGYQHGDCPMACIACGHRCEVHASDGACQAVECECPGWAEDDADETGEEPS